LEEKPSASAPVRMKVDCTTNIDIGQEINQVTVSLTDEIINERATDRPTPHRDIVTRGVARNLIWGGGINFD